MKQNKPDAQRIARNVYSFSLFECPKIFMCFLHEVRLMEYNGKVISTCLYISPPKLNLFQLNLVQEIVIYGKLKIPFYQLNKIPALYEVQTDLVNLHVCTVHQQY